MLTRLLQRMAQGGLSSTVALARELDVSEELLAQMLADLMRLGYLAPLGDGCGGGCNACSSAGGCSMGEPGSVWLLTEKGLRVARDG